MLPCMLNTQPPGNYQTAMDYALKTFRSKDPGQMAQLSGASFDQGCNCFTVNSLGQTLCVTYPEGLVTFKGTKLQPRWSWAFMTLNYLSRADGTSATNHLISYKELENGHVYFPAFYKKSLLKLAQLLGNQQPTRIKKALDTLASQMLPGADICACIDVFPRFPVTFRLWLADEELAASANLLFDSSANHYLHTEDIAEVGSLLVYLLQELTGQDV